MKKIVEENNIVLVNNSPLTYGEIPNKNCNEVQFRSKVIEEITEIKQEESTSISSYSNLSDDDCEDYNNFLDEMQIFMDKVSSGDLTDFEEL